MPRIRSAVIVLVCLALATACTQPSPPERQSQTAPNANLPAYSTFGWQPADPATADEPMRILDANIREAIRAELTRRGYTETDASPQLLVSYETEAADKLRSNPFRIGIGIGSFGGNVGGSVNMGSPSVESYQEGRLVIHVVEAAENRELWFGSTAGSVGKKGLDAAAVTRAVASAMQDFPARSAAPLAAP